MFSATLRRKIIEPLHALKSGSPKLRYWKKLEETQYHPEDILRREQWKRLTDILQYVYRENGFYRKRMQDAGITPKDIETPDDLRRIPVLTKKEIRENTSEMISKGFDSDHLLQFKTGGSTGKPLVLFITEECSEIRNACARRHDRWSGWEVGEPIGAVWGNPKIPMGIKNRLKSWLLSPTIYLDTMNVTEESVKQFSEDWEKIKPTLLFGHAHSLYVLAEYLQKLFIKTIVPKGIISSSMMLIPHERKTIEQIFGVNVFDRYGCEELGLIASECERHQGMHLNIEHLFVEFMKEDGRPAQRGEPGRIIVTDLMNKAMPFIRYQVEDVGVPSGQKCSCGRGLPLMEKVTGRVADFLIKKDSSKVAGVSLIENTLTKIPSIEQMQIVQEAIDLININVVPGKSFDQRSEEELKTYFRRLFDHQTRVEIRLVEEIKPEESGKYRFSVCKVKSV